VKATITVGYKDGQFKPATFEVSPPKPVDGTLKIASQAIMQYLADLDDDALLSWNSVTIVIDRQPIMPANAVE
jgi:hypothetical protein